MHVPLNYCFKSFLVILTMHTIVYPGTFVTECVIICYNLFHHSDLGENLSFRKPLIIRNMFVIKSDIQIIYNMIYIF